MRRLAVFASGFGSNLQAIINASRRGQIPVKVALVISDRAGAFALKRARRVGIPTLLIPPGHFPSRQTYEAKLIRHLKASHIDLIALAGFMRILSPWFVRQYPEKILNIHPALLPAFKGSNAIQEAFESGVKVTGVTVHLATEEVDAGPIILQEAVPVTGRDTLASLEAKIHRVEHRLYPQAIRLVAEQRVRVIGRRVKIHGRSD